MARVTVEDCIDKVENRFDLVLLASHRARMISSGSQITLDRDNDKNPVVALREIAETTIDIEKLHDSLIQGLQKHADTDEITEDVITAHLYQPDMPPPDLLIRTAGEMRFSNFLLWQVSYTELHVTQACWPEFREEHLDEAFESYGRRVRKFGGLVPGTAG